MPRVAKELGPLDVKRLSHLGGAVNRFVAVGGVAGLYLQITPNGAKSWILRKVVAGARRHMGLGSYPSISLSMARDRARGELEKIWGGADPVADRKTAKAALAAEQRRGLSFADAVETFLTDRIENTGGNAKHRSQWRATLETYAVPELGRMMLQDIEPRDVLRVLQPIWTSKTETASRLRGRIESVLSWATVAGHRSGDNPARWKGNLSELLPKESAVVVPDNHPALQIDQAPAWFAALRLREGSGARAVEFAALTVLRSGEVRGALWSEIDLEKGLWTVPAVRMKAKREHRVPLTVDAVALLQTMPREGDLVFNSPRGGPLSDMALSATMKRMHESEVAAGRVGYVDRVSGRLAVPHGLRSTFRDWVADRTDYPGDMAEVALAHKVANAVEAAYRRGDMIEKRRAMMAAWADYLCGAVVSEVGKHD